MVFNLYVKKRWGYLYMVLICDREVHGGYFRWFLFV